MRLQARIRQINAVVSALMTVLFVVHGVGNAFLLMNAGSPTSKLLARGVMTLAIVHAILGVWLTVATVRVRQETSVSYVRKNTRFWAVRASGLAIALFLIFHMLVFLQTGDGAYRLHVFDVPELVASVGLVLAMAVHVLCNLRPLAVSLGIGAPQARAWDAALICSLLLLLMAVAFVVYFVRWSVV